MIIELGASEIAPVDADVAIVGAGTAGLLLAAELLDSGLRVVVLESGSAQQEAETHPLNEVVLSGAAYAGARDGRFRCLGGTSTRWGGAMIPFMESDLDSMNFPVESPDLLSYLPRVEARFGLCEGPYQLDTHVTDHQEYVARLAKWPPFAKRNTARLFDRYLSGEFVQVYLNAHCTSASEKPDGGYQLVGRSLSGGQVVVSARKVVLAAGAIETTRLLLLHGAAIGARTSKELGAGFSDHLCVPAGELRVRNRKALNRLVGYRFSKGGGMQNLRFELADTSVSRSNLPPHFAHVVFTELEASGFAALRDVYRTLQQGRLPGAKTLLSLLRRLPWLTRAAWWRFAEHRLLYPDGATIELQVVLEQVRNESSTISLSVDTEDLFAQPQADIDWRITDTDVENALACVAAVAAFWNHTPLAAMAQLIPASQESVVDALTQGEGIYHPVGTTVFGGLETDAVVDPQLKVRGTHGVYALSTSLFPTAGGANPTLVELLLAMRLADRLSAER